ncbi:reverse transcriptase domain-containing protein, partial [Sinorhizobium meliloti]
MKPCLNRAAMKRPARAVTRRAQGRRRPEKFFDRVNHDILIDRLSKRISDKRVIRRIRAYLNSGIMDHGVVQERVMGTPQGGPLSPLLANVLLDEVDKEL